MAGVVVVNAVSCGSVHISYGLWRGSKATVPTTGRHDLHICSSLIRDDEWRWNGLL